jgi:hypothetical protein
MRIRRNHLKIHWSSAVQIALVIGVAIPLLTAGGVHAQEDSDARESITASPSSESFKINAGDTRRDTMLIINDGDVAYDFAVYARPYSVLNELYDPSFSVIKQNTNVHNWVQFEKTKYHLDPGQKATVNYTIKVPADAAPGGHYGVLFAETQQRGIGTTGVARQKRVGNLIYATVNGKYITSGKFDDFILPKWQKRPPFISAARVTNTGNVDFETTVSTVAKDVFGRTKFTYTGDPRVLPATTRRIEMKWDKAPSFGLFNVSQTVNFLGQTHTGSGWVLIAPTWFALLAAAIILMGVVYAVHTYRKSRR